MNAAWTQGGSMSANGDGAGGAVLQSWLTMAQGAPAGGSGQPGSAGGLFMLAILAAFMVFMLLSARSQKKREERERESLLGSLAKNDRVLTVGGIIGTIVSIKESEVVLKVDESTNTKMTFAKSAVQRIINDEAR
ncbi:MAG: preprotein translocase subunit YajC [Phycisphaerae bacterium]|nr:preprotein translocase subunit YajC [Phycisphaerae bacterium]